MPVAEKTEHRDTDERIVEIELERLRSFNCSMDYYFLEVHHKQIGLFSTKNI